MLVWELSERGDEKAENHEGVAKKREVVLAHHQDFKSTAQDCDIFHVCLSDILSACKEYNVHIPRETDSRSTVKR